MDGVVDDPLRHATYYRDPHDQPGLDGPHGMVQWACVSSTITTNTNTTNPNSDITSNTNITVKTTSVTTITFILTYDDC